MAKIFAVNAGSSSLKFQLLEMDTEEVITSGVFERIGLEEGIFTIKYNGEKDVQNLPLPDHAVAVEILLKTLVEKGIVASLDEIKGVGHRVVQGGAYFDKSEIVTESTIEKVDKLKKFAPLHNPANLTGYFAFKEAMPNAGHVMVFDTAFHQTIAPSAYVYPVPYEYYEKYGIRKYGAHGTSHKYVSQRVIDKLGNPEESKIVVCHLGAGGSLSAVKNGKCINTSMGFTPLTGIMMGTRSGDMDPSALEAIALETGKTISELVTMCNKESGFLGVSGVSSDCRDVQAAADAGNERAKLALQIFCRRVTDYIGRYFIELGGIDAIAFTAGIGENSKEVRKDICDILAPALGLVLDEEANGIRGEEVLITKPESKVKAYIIPTNEELMIARDTKELLGL